MAARDHPGHPRKGQEPIGREGVRIRQDRRKAVTRGVREAEVRGVHVVVENPVATEFVQDDPPSADPNRPRWSTGNGNVVPLK